MRRALSILPVIASLVLSTPCQARPPRWGVTVGGSIVSVDYDDEFDFWSTGSRADFFGEVSLEKPLTDRSSLLLGARYSRLGNEVEYDTRRAQEPSPVPDEVGVFRIHQNYLGVPIGIRWYPAGPDGLYLQGGGEVAVLLNASLTGESRTLPATTAVPYDDDITDAMQRWSGFLEAGLGYGVRMAGHVVELNARYSRSPIGTAKADQWLADWKTQAFSLGVGLRL